MFGRYYFTARRCVGCVGFQRTFRIQTFTRKRWRPPPPASFGLGGLEGPPCRQTFNPGLTTCTCAAVYDEARSVWATTSLVAEHTVGRASNKHVLVRTESWTGCCGVYPVISCPRRQQLIPLLTRSLYPLHTCLQNRRTFGATPYKNKSNIRSTLLIIIIIIKHNFNSNNKI